MVVFQMLVIAFRIKVKFSTSFATKEFINPLHDIESPHRNSYIAKNKLAQSFPLPLPGPLLASIVSGAHALLFFNGM